MRPPGFRSDVRGHNLSYPGVLTSVKSEQGQEMMRSIDNTLLNFDVEILVEIHLNNPLRQQGHAQKLEVGEWLQQ